jgi:exonuclease VII large subunit
LSRRLEFALKNGMKRSSERLSANANRIAALSYRATLARGYSITRSKRSGKVIQALSDVRADDRVVTEIADGKFESRVLDDQQSELFD